jgi:predicted HAD superfamily Cof-like phosphohydrolase
MVAYFTRAMGQAFDQEPDRETAKLRQTLIMEEAGEVFDELDRDVINKVALTKELADLLYVVHGTAVAFGLPLEPAFARVHYSNMSKLDEDGRPIYREDGKVVKGPNYQPPELGDLFE